MKVSVHHAAEEIPFTTLRGIDAFKVLVDIQLVLGKSVQGIALPLGCKYFTEIGDNLFRKSFPECCFQDQMLV